MYVKKIKRKCGVRGCKNTDTYAISKSREMGNSIIVCESCLVEALAEIDMKYSRREAVEGEMPIPLEPAVDEAVDGAVDEAVDEAVTEEAPADKPKRQRNK